MIKRGLISFVSAILFAAQAQAGDMSKLDILGFADGGKVFGFQESGIQDGSGHAYASRTFINTSDDTFVLGSPVLSLTEDETKSLDDIILDVTVEAARSTGYGVNAFVQSDHQIVLLSTVLDQTGTGHLVRFLLDPYFPQSRAPVTVTLSEQSFPADEARCYGFYDTESGFTLTLHQEGPAPISRILNNDQSVPSSRGCPQNYRIGGVVTHPMDNGQTALAILIQYQRLGFEGVDTRWMAVTTVLNR